MTEIFRLYRYDNRDGTQKDWAIAVAEDEQSLVVRYGRTGAPLRRQTIPATSWTTRSADDEDDRRTREKTRKGYQYISTVTFRPDGRIADGGEDDGQFSFMIDIQGLDTAALGELQKTLSETEQTAAQYAAGRLFPPPTKGRSPSGLFVPERDPAMVVSLIALKRRYGSRLTVSDPGANVIDPHWENDTLLPGDTRTRMFDLAVALGVRNKPIDVSALDTVGWF